MSTITSILSSDLLSNSRTTINNNFQNLNTDKKETGYNMVASGGVFNPASGGSIYYFGSIYAKATDTNAGIARVYIPKTGTIKAAYIFFAIAGTLGSSEPFTMAIRLNNSTDTTISSAVTATATANAFSNTSMSLAVVAGDYFEIKLTTPTWGTPPTTVRPTVQVYIE